MTLREECILINTALGFKFPELQRTSIAEFWETYWWSFLKWISKALYSADHINEKKIRDTFSNYIKEDYKDILDLENTKW